MAWITKIRIRQQTRVESFAGAVIHVGQFNISVDTLNQPPATSALTSHMEKKWKRIRIQDSDSDKFWHTYMYMWDDYRQYYHLYFDFDYFILFLCSSFRNGLSCLYESENWTPGRENNFYILVYRGYYTVARRYGFYSSGKEKISHSFGCIWTRCFTGSKLLV